jgi:biopolymer transport protein ExbD
MAMSSGLGAKGGSIADINVTPMVDIMLVLLIIFMVTASLLVSPAMRAPPQETGR